MKTLFVLVGPKGSGKSFIGTLMQKKLNIPFFRVEDVWLLLNLDPLVKGDTEKGFLKVEKEIDSRFLQENFLTIESTAAFDYFKTFLANLKIKYSVKLIKIEAPLDICLQRIKTRDQTIHIAVSDDNIRKINKIAENVQLDFDIVIENNNSSENEIIDKISAFLIKQRL